MIKLKFYTTVELLRINELMDLLAIHKYYYDFTLNFLNSHRTFFNAMDILNFKNQFYFDYSSRFFVRTDIVKRILSLQVVTFTHLTIFNTLPLGDI